jgi:hypothetical protein
MTIIYLKWRDAIHSMNEHAITELGGLAELHEIGFLIKETPDSIVIGTECQDAATNVRMWLTVPKVNIVEIKRTTLARAFPKPRARKIKPPVLRESK